jgi:hypothetical protein
LMASALMFSMSSGVRFDRCMFFRGARGAPRGAKEMFLFGRA